MITTRTPNVFFAGAGRVASVLAGALRRAGVPVLGLWGRRPEAARTAGAAAGVAAFSAGPPDLLLEADAVVLAVSDESIAQVATLLVGSGFLTRNHVLLKCSGAEPAAQVLSSVKDRVRGVGTLHPLRSIPDAKAAPSMRGTVFGVEGDPAAVELAEHLAELLGGTTIRLAEGDMSLYHAAAALASNYVVAIMDASVRAMSAAGVEGGLSALLSLARGSLDNLERVGLPDALTGPISRGDVATVQRHLQALDKRAPELAPLYRSAANHALSVARRKAEAPLDSLARIERLLSGREP